MDNELVAKKLTESSQPWITIGKSDNQVVINNTDNTEDTGNASKLCSFETMVASNGPETSRRVRTDSTASKWSDVSHKSHKSSNGTGNVRPVQDCDNVLSNLLKLRGVYIGNLKTNSSEQELKRVFKVYGDIIDFYKPAGETYVFVHYKSHESSTRLVADWNGKRLDGQCQDGKRLVIRFTASQDQMSKYNAMSYEEYRKRCNDGHECHLWRSGQRCSYDRQCKYKHVPVCRAIDTLPDKRKSKWKV